MIAVEMIPAETDLPRLTRIFSSCDGFIGEEFYKSEAAAKGALDLMMYWWKRDAEIAPSPELELKLHAKYTFVHYRMERI